MDNVVPVIHHRYIVALHCADIPAPISTMDMPANMCLELREFLYPVVQYFTARILYWCHTQLSMSRWAMGEEELGIIRDLCP